VLVTWAEAMHLQAWNANFRQMIGLLVGEFCKQENKNSW